MDELRPAQATGRRIEGRRAAPAAPDRRPRPADGDGWAGRAGSPRLVDAWLEVLRRWDAFTVVAEGVKGGLRIGPEAADRTGHHAAVAAWVDGLIADPAEQRRLAEATAASYVSCAARRVGDFPGPDGPDEAWDRRFAAALKSRAVVAAAIQASITAAIGVVLRRVTEHFADQGGTEPLAAELAERAVRHLEELARSPSAVPPAAPSVAPLPRALPQQTFQEAKAVAIALADAPRLRRWAPIQGELALRHAVKGAPLETKLVGSPLLDWLGLPNTLDSLRSELQRAGLPAVLLLHVVLGAALDKAMARRLYVTASIDELIGAIGWQPRSRAERATMRRTVWRWIALFNAMQVIGRRPGKYRDPDTRELIDLTSRDALIALTGRRDPAQLAFDDSAPPLEVTYVAGPWIEQWKGDRRVLTYFGDVRKLAAIPAGKPSGAWAQAVGLALHQRWRERAAHAEVAQVGAEKKLTVRLGAFTRRDLLTLFQPPAPTAEDVLQGPNPHRAREYWDEAIRLLKRAGVVAHYRELAPLPARRQGWADDWLDQPLDVRPAEEGREAVAEIATRARARRKAVAKRRTVPADGAV